MNHHSLSEPQVVPKAVVMDSARKFCQVFMEIPQYKAYEQANIALRNDAEAHARAENYSEKLGSLRISIKLKVVSEQENLELRNLKDAYDKMPSVIALNKADQELRAVSHKLGDILSESIGMDFGNRCRQPDAC